MRAYKLLALTTMWGAGGSSLLFFFVLRIHVQMLAPTINVVKPI
jgi:hypothetical protein